MRTADVGGVEVSVVGLGCNDFGRGLDAEQSGAVVRAALDAGITFFDTADAYGEGRSEEILSRALGGRRDTVVIATKFGLPVPGVEDSGGASSAAVAAAVDRSLRMLRRDWIDLYQLHRPDPQTPIADTLGALQGLVDAGKVRAVGCSNFGPDELNRALDVARSAGLPRFVANQVEYSAVNRLVETTGLDALCEREGVAILPYRPLAKGLLSGRMRRGDRPVRQLAKPRYQRFLTDANFDTVQRIERFAAARGLQTSQVALAWLLARPGVPAVFPGATSPGQVALNAAAADLGLSAADTEDLRQLVDGPEIPAPEPGAAGR